MLKKERADFILRTLEEKFPNPPIPLSHENTFQLLVAVLLSAQCTDQRGNKVTPALFSKAKNSKEMANLSTSEILNFIRSCGLAPKKSEAIKKLSKILVEEFDGAVPESFEHLEKLPGVGHKTASVLMSQGIGHPDFPVDTHIHRLAQRWGLTKVGSTVQRTEKDLKSLFPKNKWNSLHLQIIFYGRSDCTARGCDGTKCQICRTCYPNRRKSIK